jgi:hypothetical protein
LKASLDNIDMEEARLQNSSCFWHLLQPLENLIRTLYFRQAHGMCFDYENCLLIVTIPGRFQFKIGAESRLPGFTMSGLFIARM